MDRESDGFADAVMRQPHVGGQYTVSQSRQRLLAGVRVDRAEASEVPSVQRLQQVERLCPADFTDHDPVRAMAKSGPEKISDRYWRKRRLVAEWKLRSAGLEPQQIRLHQVNLRRLFDQDHAIAIGNVRSEGIQQCRLARSGSTGNEDVLLRRDRRHEACRQLRRQRADINQIVEAVAARELSNRQRWAVDSARRKHGG